MADNDSHMAQQEPTTIISDEVIFLNSMNDVEKISSLSPVRMDYNAIVLCRRGRVLIELGGSQQVTVKAGQLLLVPAQKLLQPIMVSTDVDAAVLLLSDRVLKSVLGAQVDIWNRAMYLHESYVIEGGHWSEVLQSQSRGVFQNDQLLLFKEIVMAFLRILLLVICDQLLRDEAMTRSDEASTDREKHLFNQFLELLHHESQKHRQVVYYAEQLCITPKYLSTVCRHVSGKAPIRWITDYVIEDCFQLLSNTNLTVKEISNRLGFPNPSFFGQYFREQTGVTPIEYRTHHKTSL